MNTGFKTMLRQTIIAFIIIVIAIVGYKTMRLLKEDPEQKIVERSPPSVSVLLVERQDRALQWQAQGVVKAEKEIQLITEVSGKILQASDQFLHGGLVEKGEVLLTVDTTDYEVALAEAKAGELNAKLDYNDKRARYQKNSLSVQQSSAQLEYAQKRVAQAQRDLNNTKIKAPFAALIKSKQVDIGQYVNKGSALAVLASTDVAELRVPIHRDHITLLSNQPLSAVLGNKYFDNEVSLSITLAGQVYKRKAKLTRVEAQVDVNTRIFYAVVTIDDPYLLQAQITDNNVASTSLPIIMGSFVDATITSKVISGAIILPLQVLRSDNSVFIVNKDGVLESRSVNVIQRQGDTVIIDNGLEKGDAVVAAPTAVLFSGMAVLVAK